MYPQRMAPAKRYTDTGELAALRVPYSFAAPHASSANATARTTSHGAPVRFMMDSGLRSWLSTPVTASKASLLQAHHEDIRTTLNTSETHTCTLCYHAMI